MGWLWHLVLLLCYREDRPAEEGGLITATAARCHIDTFARRHAEAAGEEVESKRQWEEKKTKQQHHFSLKIARVD